MRQYISKSLILACVCAFSVSLFSGCASQEAYRAYTDAVTKANAYRQQPGITQTFDTQGRLVSQSIIMPDQPVAVAQIKDSEWAAPVSMAMSLGMFSLGNWAISHEWSQATKAVQPNVTTNAGGHIAGGDVSTPVTTTTRTSTITNTPEVTTPAADQ